MKLHRQIRSGLTSVSIAFAFLVAAPLLAIGAQTSTGEIVQRTVHANGRNYPVEVFVPPGWNAQKKWPIMLFLHGTGHRIKTDGTGGEGSVAQRYQNYQNQKEAIVVFPRCFVDEYWTQPQVAAVALRALAEAAREFNGDAQRTYLGGLSMGGYGTWYIASRNPGKFAALVVVCGGIRTPTTVPIPAVNTEKNPFAATARRLRKVPVWVFHGDADDTIPVTESRQMVEALRAQGNAVRYTEYPGIKHNSWDKAFAEPEFFPWLFAQKLNSDKRSRP